MLLEQGGHAVTTATSEPQVHEACAKQSFEVAVIGQGVSLPVKHRILALVRQLCPPAAAAGRATMTENTSDHHSFVLAPPRVTLAADKGYDVGDFVAELRHMHITPHVAQNETNRPVPSTSAPRSTRDTRQQRKRKRIEEVFGWMKTVGLLRKLRHRGLEQVGWVFTFTVAAYNLVRMRNLVGSTPPQCV